MAQTKRYERSNEVTIAAGGTPDVLTIQNNSERRANFHGIRYQGRIKIDNASADNESHGLILLTCEPGGYGTLTEANVDSGSDLETRSEVIIAVQPWSVFGGSTSLVGGDTFFDFHFDIGTSRTCSKGSKIVGYVFNMAESAKSVILAHSLLSCFETTL